MSTNANTPAPIVLACTAEGCGATCGTMTAPSPDELRQLVAGSPFAAMLGSMLGSLPPDAWQGIAQMLRVRCPAHTTE